MFAVPQQWAAVPGPKDIYTSSAQHCRMAKSATFTKRIGRSRSSFVVWIPRDVATLLTLESGTIVEVRIRNLRGDHPS